MKVERGSKKARIQGQGEKIRPDPRRVEFKIVVTKEATATKCLWVM